MQALILVLLETFFSLISVAPPSVALLCFVFPLTPPTLLSRAFAGAMSYFHLMCELLRSVLDALPLFTLYLGL